MSDKLNKEGLTKVWLKVWTLVKTLTGDVDVSGKGTLQAQINNLSVKTEQCFQSASDGKSLVANAVTGKGVPTSADDTFATIADNIAAIQTSAALQSKSVALDITTPTVDITPDAGYDGLSHATASITTQEKIAVLSTVEQDITPDSGKVISKVTVPAVEGTATVENVLAGKIFSSSAGIDKIGVMPDNGAYIIETSGSGNVAIPAGYHNGEGYADCSGAYNAGKSDGTAAAKVGTAGTGDVLSGKTFTNASTVGATGTMSNKGGTTVTAGSVTQDDTYTYLGIPSSGYYSASSKVRALNSDLIKGNVVSNTSAMSTSAHSVSITVPNIKSALIIVTIAEWKSHATHEINISGADSLTLLNKTTGNGQCRNVTAIYKASVTPGATLTLNVPNPDKTNYLSCSIALVY